MAFKIVFFLPNLSGGGVEKSLLNLSGYFQSTKQNILLIVGENSGSFSSKIVDYPHKILGASSAIKSIIPLIKFLKKEKPGCVITGMPHANAILILASIFSGFKGKIVVGVHENPYTNHANKTLYERSILFICKYLYRYANGFIAVSNELLITYEKRISHLPKRRQVIANPILKQINYSRKISMNEDKPSIINLISAGRLSYEKNFQLLIHAFSELPNREKYRLKIFGEGELEKQLHDLIIQLNLSEFIQLAGFTNTLENELAQADIFILTSLWEGFGNVLVEALNAGCQIISSDCESGPREILENGRWGYLFPVNDKKALINSIVNIQPIEYTESEINAHLEKFTFDKVGKEYDYFLFNL